LEVSGGFDTLANRARCSTTIVDSARLNTKPQGEFCAPAVQQNMTTDHMTEPKEGTPKSKLDCEYMGTHLLSIEDGRSLSQRAGSRKRNFWYNPRP